MSRHLVLAAFVTLTALPACSADTTTDATSSQQEALVEAEASAADAKATAEACFATFEACSGAEDADVDACRADLKECLPAEAHPGPRCGPTRGKGKGHPHGPNGDRACDGGARPDGGGAGDRPPPPPPPRAGDEASSDGPPEGHARGDARAEPPFCGRVPLPPQAEVVACRNALDACLGGSTGAADRQACFATHQTCVKAAFDAAASRRNENDDAGETDETVLK